MEFSDDNKTNIDEEETDLNSSRQENLHWRKCLHCNVMPTFIESKCCTSVASKDLLLKINFLLDVWQRGLFLICEC